MRSYNNLHLGISAFVVIVAGLVYGFNPDNVLFPTLGFQIADLELRNIFKAIMGLYLAMGVFWIVGIANPEYWKTATLTNVLFMGGLAFGRGVSLIVDGISVPWVVGAALELLMMAWGIRNLRKAGDREGR